MPVLTDSVRARFASSDPVYTREFRGAWLRKPLSENRSLDAGKLGAGGFLLPQTMWDGILDMLRDRAWAVRETMRIQTDSAGTVILPVVDEAVQADYLHKTASLGSSTALTFSKTESVGKRLAASVVVSADLAEMMPDAEDRVSALVADALGRELERAMLIGEGGVAPLGVMRDAAVESVGVFGSAARPIDGLREALGKLAARFAERASIVMSLASLDAIAEAFPEMVQWDRVDGRAEARLWGRRVIVSDYMTDREFLVGDLRAGVFTRTPSVAAVFVLREPLAHLGRIRIIAEAFCDSGVAVPAALKRVIVEAE